jgi:hypothetical protein
LSRIDIAGGLYVPSGDADISLARRSAEEDRRGVIGFGGTLDRRTGR